ncbi:glycosyltransferase [Tsukamurella soli]|uniref:Uncharacterized protein n=1 Tax=Tsukamurella soli TaxID=644556 RepID=A0ABP8JJF3_9ACTN
MRSTYWWKGTKNFGDQINEFLLRKLGVDDWEHSDPESAELVMVGSILEHLPTRFAGTVCGAGILLPETRVDLSNARILALRGKLTANRVIGYQGQAVLGDLGLLVSRFVQQSDAVYDLGVIPHWSDTTLAQRFPHGKLIDPSGNVQDVVQQIVQCRQIISSSLHGLVVADAYGIPRQAERLTVGPYQHPKFQHTQEDRDFKFRDYASIYPDGDPHFGEMWTAPWQVVERVQEQLWAALQVAIGRPLPPEREELPTPWKPKWWHVCRRRRPQVSFIVPFRDQDEYRTRVWEWLKVYWRTHMPDAEIVIGRDNSPVFSKARAVNEGASRARGRVFVVMDADAWMDPDRLQDTVDKIDTAVQSGRKLWMMPYNHLYRLTLPATLEILDTDPKAPYWASSPPAPEWIEPDAMSGVNYGHQYGAMMMVLPTEAFFRVGGFDPRMKGWGVEDLAMLTSLDTLYAQHEVAQADILHLWHARPGAGKRGIDHINRLWAGQAFQMNHRLAQRYRAATGERAAMGGLVDERKR